MQTEPTHPPLGWWRQGACPPEPLADALAAALRDVNRPVVIVEHAGQPAVAVSGEVEIGRTDRQADRKLPLRAIVPPLPPNALGDPAFKAAHGAEYAYVAGEMANAITTVEMVRAMGQAGMLGFFGAGGLRPAEVEAAVDRLQQVQPGIPFGVNLIHSPGNLELEMAVVDIFLRRGVRLASASAYVEPTLPLVYYRIKGLRREADGSIVCPNRVVGKVSRVEVARKFLSPPPPRQVARLLERGLIDRSEAELAREIPLVGDLTAEADSGGHTDNRPAITLLPTMIALRDELSAAHRYRRPPCVGLGGGIATPQAVAAAFAMGAAYVLAGSINQCCAEAGTSAAVRAMLAEAGQADVAMAPSADMFELGVKVQVLKRGTMFPYRAAKLYELYAAHESYEQIPVQQRETIERDLLRCTFEQEWEQTRRFFHERDPRQVERAEKDPKHKMALVFRSYLGRSSMWAIAGEPTRRIDYQVWCGPAMGAFNQWVKGSCLDPPGNREVVAVAMNLMYGAAVVTRAAWLRAQGVPIPPGAATVRPLPLSEIRERLAGAGPAAQPAGGASHDEAA
jgi:PfaD family protein